MYPGCLPVRSGKIPLGAQFLYDTEILTLTRVLCSRSARAEYHEFGVCVTLRAFLALRVIGMQWKSCRKEVVNKMTRKAFCLEE